MEITLNVHISGLDGLVDALKALTPQSHVACKDPAAPAMECSQPPITMEAKTTAPVATAPIAPVAAPSITLEQICKAGADLLTANPAMMPQLTGLLQKYGAQSAQQLKPEQLGAFATELRGMGARI